MATEDDLRTNAEYIRLADEYVIVEGGSNVHNFANVDLIVKIARRCGADAVWPGWGHASENPKLPEGLANHNIAFLGPPSSAMDAVGDKICANILAQSCGVEVIPWSGSGLTLSENGNDISSKTCSIPDDLLEKATINDIERALGVVNESIGYPVMIKASEGGGGKGIRMVRNDAELRTAFPQVQQEVPNSPIFIQKLSQNSRHLEVQMVADQYGQAIALYGRDCSVQRRHQKIIEEGPITVAPRKLCEELERGAVRLAKKVGYSGVGTVEYLFNCNTGTYSFLEVNPRLQVEHPVTETITGVNIPAVQLHIAMGIPLHKIPHIRRFYAQSDVMGVSAIDFDSAKPIQPIGHCIAGRITAEDPDSGFKPTSGAIHELHFRATTGVTGNFSIGSGGGVHQFADSQFGHIFAHRETREEASTALVQTLSEFSVRGEIHCNVKYLMTLLEKDDFRANTHDTAWLDGLIAIGDRSPELPNHVVIACGAVLKASAESKKLEEQVVQCLRRGVPPEIWMANLSEHSFELIYKDIKYCLKVCMGSKSSFYIYINGRMLAAESLQLFDGGLKIILNYRSHTVYPEESKVGMKIHIDGHPCFFPEDFDASKLCANSTGKLVKFLVPNGGKCKVNEVYCEIEVMKTVMPLISTTSGIVTHVAQIGSQLETGDVLCSVIVDDPSSMKLTKPFEGDFPVSKPRKSTVCASGSHLDRFSRNSGAMIQLLQGYHFDGNPLEELFEVLGTMELVVEDFKETRDAIASRLGEKATKDLQLIAYDIESSQSSQAGSMRYTNTVTAAVQNVRKIIQEQDGVFAPLIKFCERHEGGLYSSKARVLTGYIEVFLDIEETFASCASFEDAIMLLREKHRDDVFAVTQYAHAHVKLERRSDLIVRILDHIADNGFMDISACHSAVHRCMNLVGKRHEKLSQRAREIIVKKQEISRQSRREKMAAERSRVRREESFASFTQLSLNESSDQIVAGGGGSHSRSNSRGLRSAGSLYGSELDLQSMISEDESSLSYTGGGESTPTNTTSAASQQTFSRNVGRIFLDKQNTLSRLESYDNMAEIENPHLQYNWDSLFDGVSETARFDAIAALFLSTGIDLKKIPGADPEPCRSEMTVTCVRLNGAESIVLFAPSLGQAVAALPEASDLEPSELAFVISYPRLVGRDEKEVHAAAAAFVTGQHLAGAFTTSTIKVSVTLLSLDARPHHFAFKRSGSAASGPDGFEEMRAASGFWPHVASHMEVDRLDPFEKIECVGKLNSRTRQRNPNFVTPSDYSIGVFLAEEAPRKPGHKQPQRDRRVFLRAAVYDKDLLLVNFSPNPTPRPSRVSYSDSTVSTDDAPFLPPEDSVLADVLGSLELAVGSNQTAWNHVFIHLVGADDKLDLPHVESAIDSFVTLAFADLKRLKVVCVEVRVGDSGSVVALNTSGLKFKIQTSLDRGVPEPHPLLNLTQRKRMVAQNLSSTYVYDFPEIFANILHEEGGGISAIIELALQGGSYSGGVSGAGPTSPRSSIGSILEILPGQKRKLIPANRPAGQNDCGMVCWKLTLNTKEYKEGRDVILVSNDITHMSGSLSPPEDAVYRAAMDLSIDLGIPCVYVAANSGARIGLDEAVKAAFQVCWIDEKDPRKGFRYIYLSEDDYEMLGANGRVKGTRLLDDNEVRYALTDICGGQGVECLQGSGEIAAATSRAYQNIVTIAYVTARSVGIGAYCSRLCQRLIQHQEAPLILTGASALNKVLGRDVYTSNAQIGGPKVMGSNGVSHIVVPDDVQGVKSILNWLSYVPASTGGALPFYRTPLSPDFDDYEERHREDSIHRTLIFDPSAQSPYDPREILRDFFDENSFTEVMADWGRTVVTGRARLGGLPIGCVAVETRTVSKTIPADPAFPGAQIGEETQAGQVWFPDSAFKTAQAIGDMNREGLPLIIFANWRGFAGGLRDMYGEVLKYGACIVDALREFRQPIFVYIPRGGELRGGAWVVIDSSINPEQMEFYASDGAKGGVLEPEGIVDIKFRNDDLMKTMKRTVKSLEHTSHLQKQLTPTMKQLAVHFASLHDTPGVMLHKRAIKSIVEWETSREFFAIRLRRRVCEERIKRFLRKEAKREITLEEMRSYLCELEHVIDSVVDANDGPVEPEKIQAVIEFIANISY
jgi:acetyl-CoA carboxylase / biotin carboxylase 2